MQYRIAAIMALIVFAVCLFISGIQVENTFATTVSRALTAMAGTFVIGLLIGTAAQKMLDENIKGEEEKLKNSKDSEGSDR